MSIEDQYKLLVEAYYGITYIDEYDLKVYVLKEIKKLIDNFENQYNINNSDDINEYVKNNVDIKALLQSSLIVLNKMDGYVELVLLIKNRLNMLKNEVKIW